MYQYRKASSKVKTEDNNIIELLSSDDSHEDWGRKRANSGKGEKARARSEVVVKDEGGSGDGQGKIEVTWQLKVDGVVCMTDIPTCWTVSRPNHIIATVLDIRSDTREWWDSKGKLLSMAAIIKSQVCFLLTFRVDITHSFD